MLEAAGRGGDIVPALQVYADRDKRNRPLAAVLAAEMARDPITRPAGDQMLAEIAGSTAEPAVIAIVVRSYLDTRRPIKIIQDLDAAFARLQDDKEKPATPARKQFAADKARAVAAALENDPKGVSNILIAASDELRSGRKRHRDTYFFLGSLAARHGQLDRAILQFEQAVRIAPPASLWEAYARSHPRIVAGAAPGRGGQTLP